MVVATKKGKRRTFSDQSWALLGANKEGWAPMPETSITNIAKPAHRAAPSTGAKAKTEQPIHDVTSKPAEQKIEDVTDKTSGTAQSDAPDQAEKEATFRKAAEGLNGGIIKDFFDAKGIDYDKSAKKKALITQLGETLSWDVVEFQKLFS